MLQAMFEPHIVTWDGFWSIVLVDTDSRTPINQLATPNNDAGVILNNQAAAPIVLKSKNSSDPKK
jgi:hypothetical protein